MIKENFKAGHKNTIFGIKIVNFLRLSQLLRKKFVNLYIFVIVEKTNIISKMVFVFNFLILGGQGVHAASHQRQLSLKYSEIQQRLINNQGLLNTLEKAASPTLDNLLRELKHRIEYDKEALRQWTALRKSNFRTNAKNPPLAARLLQCARGCGLALQLMTEENVREIQIEENTVADYYEEESSSAGYHTDESGSPTPEPGDPNASDTYQSLPSVADMTVGQLAERYGSLYAQAQLHTLDALDALEPLKDAPELKAKILYSVVVVRQNFYLIYLILTN